MSKAMFPVITLWAMAVTCAIVGVLLQWQHVETVKDLAIALSIVTIFILATSLEDK